MGRPSRVPPPPDLPLARCIGHADLFLAPEGEEFYTRKYREKAALEYCEFCPELEPCRAWLASLPMEAKPSGTVIAGRVIRQYSTKKMKEETIHGRPA